MLWDATCVDTLCQTNLAGCVAVAGAAAVAAERRKRVTNAALEERFIFVPVAVETCGPWGPAAKDLISAIGRKITERTGEKRATTFLHQIMSIEIQRGNSASVLNTHTQTRGLEEIFMF